ncbi:bifunctional 5,10-methylenetetrahydrofolate dehydrogenase/5,10-methenyltetrahydrofolate cyclohydrolase [Actinocatenispora rupis]|uniref:Bifunctional protein FolD n=1 Tax=Actinocatenispora rupis TaxID=519421 RepID=A0A8J3J0C7_9ACTN|nr:bifunctional 5,10-methylenetetrahydrofolate dehydrogenase/5,10-methenyltetrahydrofolate cyclohydrolase [Actinocatenispora rupis]GID09617.1 bifunctional protein FolD [Actinocatenispora rupis]
MTARTIDGRAIAAALRAELADRVAAAPVRPCLAVVVPTDDEGTAWYVRQLRRTAERLGVECRVIGPPVPAERLVAELTALSADPGVHGVLCQTPLPAGLTPVEVGLAIDVAKDVDGANPLSAGLLAAGAPAYAPATAAAVLAILRAEAVPLAGRHAVVVGRSTVVGRPAATLLLAQQATVTVCHSRTADLAEHTRRADVLVAAVGRAGLIGAAHVAPGAVVVDVGTNPTADGGLVGDVRTEEVAEVAAAITPVPGGVGPVTTAVLLSQVVAAATA